MLRSIFINPQEHRLRAFWRLAVQACAYFSLVFLAQLVSSMVILVIGSVYVISSQGVQVKTSSPVQRTMQDLLNLPPIAIFAAFLSLAVIFLFYYLAAHFLDRRPFRDYGFHFNQRWWTDFAFGIFLGALIMTIFFLVELQLGWISVTSTFHSFRPGLSFLSGIFVLLAVYVFVGFSEEMLSRGYQLRNLAEGLNIGSRIPRAALLIAYIGSSAFFGMLHFFNPNASLLSTLYLIGAGMLLGFGYILTGELAIPIGLHIGWNFFQGCVFGFPVSGIAPTASFIAIQQGGPLAWTGGPFGPEGGLLHPLAALFGGLLIFIWMRWRYGRAVLQDRLAQYSPPVIQSGTTKISG